MNYILILSVIYIHNYLYIKKITEFISSKNKMKINCSNVYILKISTTFAVSV